MCAGGHVGHVKMFEIATLSFTCVGITFLTLGQIPSHLIPSQRIPLVSHSSLAVDCISCLPQTLQWFPFAFGVGLKVLT